MTHQIPQKNIRSMLGCCFWWCCNSLNQMRSQITSRKAQKYTFSSTRGRMRRLGCGRFVQTTLWCHSACEKLSFTCTHRCTVTRVLKNIHIGTHIGQYKSGKWKKKKKSFFWPRVPLLREPKGARVTSASLLFQAVILWLVLSCVRHNLPPSTWKGSTRRPHI